MTLSITDNDTESIVENLPPRKYVSKTVLLLTEQIIPYYTLLSRIETLVNTLTHLMKPGQTQCPSPARTVREKKILGHSH